MSNTSLISPSLRRDLEKSPDFYLLSADQGRVFRKSTEAIGAVAAIVLGLQFILYGFSSVANIYLPMSIIAPAQIWGIEMFSLGLLRITVLIVNGWWPLGHLVRKWLSVGFIFGVWAPIATCFWWTFFIELFDSAPNKVYTGIAFGVFALGIELLIFYAHTSFVYAVKDRQRND